MSRDTAEKVFSYLERHHMLEPGDRVVVGVSGGADSVCLLFLLCELRERWGRNLHLAVVHVHHGIREDAGQDEAYVRELCGRLGVDFRAMREDVPARAREWGISVEEAGRRVRYAAFRARAQEFAREKKTACADEEVLPPEASTRETADVRIAVAHNAGDHAETVLFRLFRGTGLRGLCGIPPVRGEIIRPLLCLERSEIEAYLTERGIVWRNDPTNGSDAYMRNRIRNRILPEAERVAQGSVPHIVRTAAELREIEDFLAETARAALRECEESEQGAQAGTGQSSTRTVVDAERFLSCHRAVQDRMLLDLLERQSGGRDITSVHIERVRELFERSGNREIALPFGIYARRSYGRVELGRERVPENFGCPECKTIYTKCFDYDKIKQIPLDLRTRESGDYLYLADGRGGFFRKSVKSYLIDRKIPLGERERIPVLASGNRCVWLVGHRADAELEGSPGARMAEVTVAVWADGSAEWSLSGPDGRGQEERKGGQANGGTD